VVLTKHDQKINKKSKIFYNMLEVHFEKVSAVMFVL
jgi:hypothetical protein